MLNNCYNGKHKWESIATFKKNSWDFDESPSDVQWCSVCGCIKIEQTGWGVTRTVDTKTPEITKHEKQNIKAERDKGASI